MAPSSTLIAVCSVQSSQGMPMELMALFGLPSATATVSHESHCASGMMSQNRGFVPPTVWPNGAATWNAAGTDMSRFSPFSPKIE